MNIVINMLAVRAPYSGAAVYSFNLIKHLPRNINSEFKIIIFCQQSLKQKMVELRLLESQNKNISFQFISLNNVFTRILFEQCIFPQILKKIKPDIVHSVSNILPLLYKGRQTLTAHDVIFKKYPMRYSFLKRMYYTFFIFKSIKKADIIFCPTDNTAADIRKYYDFAKFKIYVLPYSVNTFLTKQPENENEIKQNLKLPIKYFLFVGALEPGKNIDFLIELMDKKKTIAEEYKLVIVGNKGWKYKLRQRAYIYLLSGLNEIELSVVYKNAAVLLYPPQYEGVGMPALEAEYFDIPVICSDYPAAYEITAADNILPLDIERWLERIKEILLTEKKTNKLIAENKDWNYYIINLLEKWRKKC